MVIDGKTMAAEMKAELKSEVIELQKRGLRPSLSVILVGDNEASKIYVHNKEKDLEECLVQSNTYRLPAETSEEELLSLIDALNENKTVNGILVQVPLPKHINEYNVLSKIAPEKDVDGFSPTSVGNLQIGMDSLFPCTAIGVVDMLKASGVEIAGKNAVIVGRSNIVGKPLAMLLLKENATVTICHSKTANLKEICKAADILVVAIGRAKFITGEYVKEGAAVIDVGINRVDGKVVGDVDFESAKDVAGVISKVPGGVGLMTRAELVKNVIKACKQSAEK